ncbi:unnamed protein product [Alopecurus aequalis]
MAGEVGEEALKYILSRAMLAAKNLRAQRDRLLQLRRQLPQQQSPDDDGAVAVYVVASGLHEVYSAGLHYGASYLADCLETAAKKGDRASFSTPAFTIIPEEQLYGVLLEQWHPLRANNQAQAFARIESAYYAAPFLSHCIELLVGVRPPPFDGEDHPGRTMTGYSEDPVAAANEYLFKRAENGFLDPDPDPTPTAAAAATGEPPEAASGVDLDQALSYLHRACCLTTLAFKHLDVAVAFISSLLDPELVAYMSEWVAENVYISEDGPYPSDDSD